jgi:hypothetical protein
MMFDFYKFYKGLFERTSYFDHYLEKYPAGMGRKYKREILVLLSENIKDKNPVSLAHTLTVAYLDGADGDYTDLLIYLLDQDWHTLQEDVISILELAKDPKSIECLYRTALNIPGYDDGRSVAKKCIWALGAINTSEARDKLKQLSEINDPIIREVASMQINHNAS